MQIRQADELDLPELARMGLAFVWGTRYGDLFSPNLEQMSAYARLAMANGVILVADAGERRLVGMIAIIAAAFPDGTPYADEVAWWVDISHRRGSVGPRLLCAAETWARQKDISVLKMVAPVGTEVGRYYERNGYAAIETAFLKRL